MKMIKLLSRKAIFQTKLFTVNEDEVELPTGSKRTYHNFLRKPAISVFPITENFEIYLIDQYRYLLEKRVIEAVAGFVDEGEDTLTAAKRELQEETGIVAKDMRELLTIKAAGSIATWDQPIILAKDLTFEQAAPEEFEDIKLIKMPLDEAVQKVIDGHILNAPTIVGILLIDTLRRNGKL